MQDVPTIGLDIAKSVFQVHGIDADGRVVIRYNPPILEGIDFAAVDQRFEAARFERSLKPISEGHVLARVGDENSGLRPGLVRRIRPSQPPRATPHRREYTTKETEDMAPASGIVGNGRGTAKIRWLFLPPKADIGLGVSLSSTLSARLAIFPDLE